jgi:PIN domain nuclease of toxin-antitoxin system
VAAVILLDTHVVVWLYHDPERLVPAAVRQRLQDEPLALSPFVRLELQYLCEVKKVSASAETIVGYLVPKLEITLTDPPSDMVCQVATTLDWTRDPFDRLIAAQSLATRTPLLTKDRTIRAHLSLAWWA